jgi:hypothetical protein
MAYSWCEATDPKIITKLIYTYLIDLEHLTDQEYGGITACRAWAAPYKIATEPQYDIRTIPLLGLNEDLPESCQERRS